MPSLLFLLGGFIMTNKQRREIRYFYKWLKNFFSSTEKEKNLIMVEISRDKELYDFLFSIKDYDEKKQQEFLESLLDFYD